MGKKYSENEYFSPVVCSTDQFTWLCNATRYMLSCCYLRLLNRGKLDYHVTATIYSTNTLNIDEPRYSSTCSLHVSLMSVIGPRIWLSRPWRLLPLLVQWVIPETPDTQIYCTQNTHISNLVGKHELKLGCCLKGVTVQAFGKHFGKILREYRPLSQS